MGTLTEKNSVGLTSIILSHEELWLSRVCISEVTSRLTTLCTMLHTVFSAPSLFHRAR